MTVTEAAEILNQKADAWDGDGSLPSIIWNAARRLSKDRAFNLAAYMKYNYGPCLHGETDNNWLDEARGIINFVDR